MAGRTREFGRAGWPGDRALISCILMFVAVGTGTALLFSAGARAYHRRGTFYSGVYQVYFGLAWPLSAGVRVPAEPLVWAALTR